MESMHLTPGWRPVKLSNECVQEQMCWESSMISIKNHCCFDNLLSKALGSTVDPLPLIPITLYITVVAEACIIRDAKAWFRQITFKMRVDNHDSKCGINIARVLFDVMLDLVSHQKDLIRLAWNGLRCKLNDTVHLKSSRWQAGDGKGRPILTY